MREAFASKTTAEWSEFLAGQPEIINERIQNYDELLLDPQVAANGYLVDVDVPKFGTARVVTNVVHLSDTPGGGVRRPPPLLGEHTGEVMEELGFSPEEIDEVVGSGVGAVEPIIAAIFDD
jgi:crotonobetainyl-CoA:carnitine CoA-transferase CaiB-like acyl-CoA transferase